MPKVTGHGGRREGSGRKPMPGAVPKLFYLTQQHVDRLARYRQQHGLTSASQALRHLIEEHA